MAVREFVREAEFLKLLQRCKERDNVTNFAYLAATWLVLAALLSGTIAFYVWRQQQGLFWLWDVPVTMLAIALIGAGQHHLGTLGHEASHFSLFRNRLLNEAASDLFCMFPLFSMTNVYRKQHLAHHKYVNDPTLDPDQYQLQASGHKFEFPKTPRELGRLLLTQLWPLNQAKYSIARMLYVHRDGESSPTEPAAASLPREYSRSGAFPTLVGFGWLFAVIGLQAWFVARHDPVLLAIVPTAGALVGAVVLACIPPRRYLAPEPRCPISRPVHAAMQMVVYSTMMTVVAWLAYWFGPQAIGWFFLLWVVPLLTAFSFYMMLRQVLHHSNADRGWLTNSRNFVVGPLFRFTVFPLGQDMHLVHHMFSSIPHYNLHALHRAMRAYPEYCEGAVEVDRWVIPKPAETRNPTMTEILGPQYAVTGPDDPFIDYTVDEVGRD